MTLAGQQTPVAAAWCAVCPVERLTAGRGVAAFVDGHAIAIFLLADDDVRAIDNVDPVSGASVLSRGLVGDVDGAATVASPLYKQRFDLRTGACLDVEDAFVAVHEARVTDGMLEVRLAPASGAGVSAC